MEHNTLLGFAAQWNVVTLLGIALLLGLLAGEIVTRMRYIPRISGYIAIGFLLGAGGFNIVTHETLHPTHLFVDISLGIILFELGRYLDFTWLKNDRGLFSMALTESILTLVLIFCVAYWVIGFSLLAALLTACFFIATSPAVVMMVAHDLGAQGPVTRRTLVLTSLNNLFALLLFNILFPMIYVENAVAHYVPTLEKISYVIFGSILLAFLMCGATLLMAKMIGKRKENQFVLYIGVLILTIGIARASHLSSALTLFLLGAATRNLDFKHVLMEMDFGWAARLFFIVLFMVIGFHMRLDGLWQAALIVLLLIAMRIAAKTLGIWLFAAKSQLTVKQTLLISVALTPMAGLAMSMSALNDFSLIANQHMVMLIILVTTILEIIGPLATQFAFIRAKETIPEITS